MNKRKFDEEEATSTNLQHDTLLNYESETSLPPIFPSDHSTHHQQPSHSIHISDPSNNSNPSNSDQLTPKKRKINSISPSDLNNIHTFTPDSTTLDFRIMNLKSASSSIPEDDGIIDSNIPEITSIMNDDSTLFSDDSDELPYLSSKYTSTEREEIRAKTKKFIEFQKLNEQLYVQHVVKYVQSISEVNRIVNIGEWFGTEELEESFVQGVSSFPSQENLKLSQVSLMCATNPKGSQCKTTPEIVLLPKVFSALIKPHQLEGIRFCWSHIVLPTDENLKGCVLGHSNGLGKTLTVIAFSYLFLKYNKGKKILIICPRSVIQNWEREISSWLHSLRLEYIPCYVLDHGKDSRTSRLEKLQEWDSKGGILLMCFTSFSRWTETQYSTIDPKQSNKYEFEKKIAEYLRGCDLAIVDEGHRLKTPNSSICKALYCNILTRNRIVLTGVPPQFDLMEYYTILDWIRPGYWSLNEFRHLFIDPIRSGLNDASTQEHINQMKQRYFVLLHELSYFVHRKDQSVLKSYLPPKREYVIQFYPHDIQVSLYNNFIQSRDTPEQCIFYVTCMLQKILNHPDWVIEYCQINKPKDTTSNSLTVQLFSDDRLDLDGNLTKSLHSDRNSYSLLTEISEEDMSVAPSISNTMFNMLDKAEKYRDNSQNVEWASPVQSRSYIMNCIDHSPKMLCLIRMIEQCFLSNEKILVFSQYQETLDIIERIINNVNITTGLPLEDEHQPLKRKLKRNLDYYRLDETMSVSLGQSVVDSFNSSADAPLLLISTKVGSLGIDLSTSQKIVLYDVCWDHSWDNQAVFRSFRYGQTKPVSIYRFVMYNTIESKIFEKLCTKISPFKNLSEDKKDFLTKNDFVPYTKPDSVNYTISKTDNLLSNVLNSDARIYRYLKSISDYESLYIETSDETSSNEQNNYKSKYDTDFSNYTTKERSRNYFTSTSEEGDESDESEPYQSESSDTEVELDSEELEEDI